MARIIIDSEESDGVQLTFQKQIPIEIAGQVIVLVAQYLESLTPSKNEKK